MKIESSALYSVFCTISVYDSCPSAVGQRRILCMMLYRAQVEKQVTETQRTQQSETVHTPVAEQNCVLENFQNMSFSLSLFKEQGQAPKHSTLRMILLVKSNLEACSQNVFLNNFWIGCEHLVIKRFYIFLFKFKKPNSPEDKVYIPIRQVAGADWMPCL